MAMAWVREVTRPPDELLRLPFAYSAMTLWILARARGPEGLLVCFMAG